MLIDYAKVYVSAGSGGNGCQSLYKDMLNRRGVPDGGSGGPGGDIIIKIDPNLNTLLDFKYNQHYRAKGGKHGGSNNKTGRRGIDCLIRVPVGTIIKDTENDFVIRDLAVLGEEVIVAKGGSGGKGNSGGGEATPGGPGESRVLIFELKLVADAGIIGFPNAGKSTLVSKISRAHTKVAPYPFTTQSPILGVVKLGDHDFVVADMPGLIEGAHAGRGLGDRFLRHIERTKILVHVVDIAPMDGSDPLDNYFKLEKELQLYSQVVYKKSRVIAANKMDLPGAEENLKRFIGGVKKKVWPISALKGEGLKELIKIIYEEIEYAEGKNKESNDQAWNQGSYGRPE